MSTDNVTVHNSVYLTNTVIHSTDHQALIPQPSKSNPFTYTSSQYLSDLLLIRPDRDLVIGGDGHDAALSSNFVVLMLVPPTVGVSTLTL